MACPRADYPGEDHDWSCSADQRYCRKCMLRETYGGMGECFHAHDWGVDDKVRVCRRCGLRIRRVDEDDGAAGW